MSNNSGASSASSNGRARGKMKGLPKACWCGAKIVARNSKSEPNPCRRYFRCSFAAANKLINDNHTFKWVDEALINEIKTLQLKNATLEQEKKELQEHGMRIELNIQEEISERVAEVKRNVKKMVVFLVLGAFFMMGVIKLVY